MSGIISYFDEAKPPERTALEKRWGKTILSFEGWTAVPNAILHYQEELELSAMDLNVLMQVLTFWREKERYPFPSYRRIADRIGVSKKTVQRSIRKMQELGYISREPGYLHGRGTNVLVLDGLVQKLKTYANEEIDRRATDKHTYGFDPAGPR